MRLLPAAVAIGALAVLSACGDGSGDRKASTKPETPSARRSVETPVQWPDPERYEPDGAEIYPNGKRLAANVAATILTYPRGASARRIARRLRVIS